ncbi:MAG: glycoside hydrolase family 1 [Actinomycetia bacterium]|nr:glycoside hydrolase family 1 [Actinomycetes bacterium]
MSIDFPEGFVWGTAAAAHQVEGGNWNNDWWAWEHNPSSPCKEPSGDACDHFWRYPQDIALLSDLGFGAYRFSLEWSRIEPEDGEFSRNALDHYKRMVQSCRDHGILPVLTYHHFTTPRWLADRGGWLEDETAERFARFCDVAVQELGDEVAMSCTLNEPNAVALMGFLLGEFPPGGKDFEGYNRATEVLLRAHRLSYDAIKAGPGSGPVGMTLSMADFVAGDGAEEMMQGARATIEDVWLENCRGDDFIGAQMYTRLRIGRSGMPLPPEAGVETTLMGYEFWPRSCEVTVRRAAEMTGSPVYVTENGIAATNDDDRIRYVTEALEGVKRCLDDGVDVRGYFYWSCLDNFEWAYGYGPTFGLIAVDRRTQARTVKPSGHWMGAIARSNRLP